MTDTTPEGALGRLVAWLGDEPGITVDEGGVATVAGEPPLQISFDADDDKVVLTHEHVEAGAGAARADTIRPDDPDDEVRPKDRLPIPDDNERVELPEPDRDDHRSR